MSSRTPPREKLRKILPLLQRAHGRRAWRRDGSALDALVEAMLAQNTNLVNAAAGFKQLRRAFPTWRKVMDAPVDDVQRQIAVCGLARMRARRLQDLLRRVRDERGKLCLEFLADREPQAAYDYLTSFHGIGPKTAAYTLLFTFNMPLFPVDNGILRLSKRLRLVRAKARDAEASRVLGKLSPKGKTYALHVLMFRHAKAICRPRNPKCADCPLLDLCPHGRRRVRHRPDEQLPPEPRRPRPIILSGFASAGIPKHGDADLADGRSRSAVIVRRR